MGIREARGEFIGFLDSDDAWHPSKIERQLSLMEDREVDAEGKPIQIVRGGMRGWPLVDHALLRSPILGGGSGSVLRRECFAEVGGFDVNLSMSADWEMWRRVMGMYRVEFVEEPVLDYRVHASAAHHNTPFRQQGKRLELFEHDVSHALDSMFSDPAAARVRPYKRIAYAKAYSLFAAGHYLAGHPRRATRYAVNSVVLSPSPLAHILIRKVPSQMARLRMRHAGSRTTGAILP